MVSLPWFPKNLGLQHQDLIIQRLHAACTHQEMPRHGGRVDHGPRSPKAGFFAANIGKTRDKLGKKWKHWENTGNNWSNIGKMGIKPDVFSIKQVILYREEGFNDWTRQVKSINQQFFLGHADTIEPCAGFGIPTIWGWNPKDWNYPIKKWRLI